MALGNPRDFDLRIDNGKDYQIISFQIGWIDLDTYAYNKAIDLKSFMKEFTQVLEANLFLDIVGEKDEVDKGEFLGYHAKPGEHASHNSEKGVNSRGYVLDVPVRRSGDTYETKFYWNKLPNGRLDVEWGLKAYRVATIASKYGWYELKIDLSCRSCEEVEEEVGGRKVKLLKSQWEFRNEFEYKDRIIPEFLNKIPIIGESKSKFSKIIKELYLHHIYKSTLQQEERYIVYELFPKLNAIVLKYFT